MIDRVTQDEINHERSIEHALEAHEGQIETLAEQVRDEIEAGEHDSDLPDWLLTYMDGPEIARIVRTLVDHSDDPVLAVSRLANEIRSAEIAIEDYARDIAEGWLE